MDYQVWRASSALPLPTPTLPYPNPYPTLSYPTQVWRASADEHSNLSTRLLQSNPILEATGNAKTARPVGRRWERQDGAPPPHPLPHCTAWPH